MIKPIETYRIRSIKEHGISVTIYAVMKPEGWYYGYTVDPAWNFMPYVFMIWGGKGSPGPFRDRTECFEMSIAGLNEKIDEVCDRSDLDDEIRDGLRTAQDLTLWLDEPMFDEYTAIEEHIKDHTTYEYVVGKVKVELDHAFVDGLWCSHCCYSGATTARLSPLTVHDNPHENRNISFSQAIDSVIPWLVKDIVESENSCCSDAEKADASRLIRELRAYKKTLAAEQVALF